MIQKTHCECQRSLNLLFFYVIHARTHVVGGVGSVTNLQVKNVNKL